MALKKQSFDVEGMSCSACSASIERVVGRLSGVESAQVSLTAKRLYCEYDPEVTDDSSVISAVEKAGFTAKVHGDGETKKICTCRKFRRCRRNQTSDILRFFSDPDVCIHGSYAAFAVYRSSP